MTETFYQVMRRQGITRRSYLKFCSLTAASLGLAPAFAPTIAHALETKPRTPVLWLHGLEWPKDWLGRKHHTRRFIRPKANPPEHFVSGP